MQSGNKCRQYSGRAKKNRLIAKIQWITTFNNRVINVELDHDCTKRFTG